MAANTEKIVIQVQVKGVRQVQQLEKSTKRATKATGGFTKSMVRAGAAIGSALIIFRLLNRTLGEAFRTFTKFEFQMAKVQAVSGASEKEFKKLTETAKQLGRTTFFTATQVAELQTNFARLGFTTQEILDAQEATLLLATATGSDLGRAATVAGAAVRGFGLDASETKRVVDVMTLSFNSSALDIEKWQTSMTKVAPIAAGMGISIEHTAGIMGTLTDAGIEASIAGTSMRNIFLQMSDSSSDLAKHLGFTVSSSVDLDAALEKLTHASSDTLRSLVQVRQVAAFRVMVEGAGRVKALTEALQNAEGAADEAASIIGDTTEGAILRLKSAAEGLYIELTGRLGVGIKEMIDMLAQWLNRLTDNATQFVKNIKVIGQVIKFLGILKIALIAARAATVFVNGAIYSSIASMGLWATATRLATIATWSLNRAVIALKISWKGLLVASGVGILIVALTELAEKFLFTSDAMGEAATNTEKLEQEYRKLAKAQKEADDLITNNLATTVKESKAQEDAIELMLKKWEKKQEIAKKELEQLTEGTKAYRDLEDQIQSNYETLTSLAKKQVRIIVNTESVISLEKKKALDKDIKTQESKYAKELLALKQSYLDTGMEKDVFDRKKEEKELAHLIAMKGLLILHKQDTQEIDAEILAQRIKMHHQTLQAKKDADAKTKSDADKEAARIEKEFQDQIKLYEKNKREEQNLDKESYAKGIIDKEEYDQRIFESELGHLEQMKMLYQAYGKDITAIDGEIFDLKIGNLEKLQQATKTSDDKDKDDKKESSSAALEVAQETSDAMFTIDKQNRDRRQSHDLKMLEERKEAGVITQEQYEAQVDKINQRAFAREQSANMGQALMNGALAIMKIHATAIPPISFAMLAPVIASTAAQVGIIASQKYADGGMVYGNSHAQGGEKFGVGGRVVELEGGEAVINKRSTSMYKPLLSSINSAGGGVKFADGGLLNQPSFTQSQFNALGQAGMMGAISQGSQVVVVESDITDSQNTVSTIQSQASF